MLTDARTGRRFATSICRFRVPALVASLMFAFLTSWNEFIFALILTQNIDAQTLPIVISGFVMDFTTSFSFVNAAGVIAIVPPGGARVPVRAIHRVRPDRRRREGLSMARIRCEGVTKRYGSVLAVSALDLDIADREFMVFLGPSGCGKTTTLNIIAGLEQISDGEIWFDDRRVTLIPPHKREIAMVFQSYALYPQKTVYENIAFGLRMRGEPAGRDRREGQGRGRRARDLPPARPQASAAIRRPAPARGARPRASAQAHGVFDG